MFRESRLNLFFEEVHVRSIYWTWDYIRRKKPDIIITRDIRRINTLIVLFFGIVYRKKNIIYYQENLSRLRHPLYKAVVRFLDWTGTYLVSPCFKLGFKSGRLQSLPFLFSVVDQQAEIHTNGSELRFLSVGKFTRRKRHDWTLKAFAKLREVNPKVRLHVIGEVSNDDHEECFASFNELLETLNLQGIVSVDVNIPHEEMKEHYSKATHFVLASRNEPASYSVLESLSFGLPTLSSDKNGTAIYLTEGVNGLTFKEEDFDDFCHRLIQLSTLKSDLDFNVRLSSQCSCIFDGFFKNV